MEAKHVIAFGLIGGGIYYFFYLQKQRANFNSFSNALYGERIPGEENHNSWNNPYNFDLSKFNVKVDDFRGTQTGLNYIDDTHYYKQIGTTIHKYNEWEGHGDRWLWKMMGTPESHRVVIYRAII